MVDLTSGFGEVDGGGEMEGGRMEKWRGGKRKGGGLMEDLKLRWLVVLSQKQAIN